MAGVSFLTKLHWLSERGNCLAFLPALAIFLLKKICVARVCGLCVFFNF
jgi:hypothetical protein